MRAGAGSVGGGGDGSQADNSGTPASAQHTTKALNLVIWILSGTVAVAWSPPVLGGSYRPPLHCSSTRQGPGAQGSVAPDAAGMIEGRRKSFDPA